MKRRDKALIFDYFGVLSSEVAPFWLERYFDRETAARLKAQVVARADRGELTEEGYREEYELLDFLRKRKSLLRRKSRCRRIRRSRNGWNRLKRSLTTPNGFWRALPASSCFCC